MNATTDDAFLGGRVTVRQPAAGYRAGADPVLLAAAVPARAGESVLELGCGAATALLCLAARVPGVVLTGIERDSAMVDLARTNAALNRVAAEIVTADLARLPPEVAGKSFDHVMVNPPHFDRGRGTGAPEATREAGRGEDTPLALWIDVGVRRLKPGGTLTVIQRADRLPDLLGAFDDRLGDVTVVPFAPREGRAAKLVIVQARKGAKGAFRMTFPVVLHDGPRHERDGDDYSVRAKAILRDGQALDVAKLITT